MNVRLLFYTPAGTVRAFWRIVLFLFGVVASGVIAGTLLSPIVVWIYGLIGLRSVSTDGWIEVAALLGGHLFALRWVDKRSWGEVGLDPAAAQPWVLLRGLTLGMVTIGVPIVALIAVGSLARAPGASGAGEGAAAWISATARVTMFLLPAAFAEELLARGYIFSVIRDASNWRWSLAITSIGFGLLHLQNNGATASSLTLVMLAGVFLGAVRVATGSLYAAWMAHFGWNWTMAALFHTAVSGYPMEAPAYRYVDAGPNWATGGAWGPEASFPAGVTMLVVLGYFFARQRRRQENERWPSG